MRIPAIVAPSLLAIHPVLYVFNRNLPLAFGYVQQKPAALLYLLLFPFLITVGFALILVGACYAFLRDWLKAGVLASVLVVLFFSYGHVFEVIDAGAPALAKHRYWMPLYAAVALTCAYLIRKRSANLAPVNSFLVLVSLSLILFNAIQVVSYSLAASRLSHGLAVEAKNRAIALHNATKVVDERCCPDIYYFVFDRYGGAETLRRSYGFDNGPFLRELERKGLYIAARSRSNYVKTSHSLAASLNMSYLDDLVARVDENTTDLNPILQKIDRHVVGEFLRLKGYKMVHYGSWWLPTNIQPDVDKHFNQFGPAALLYDNYHSSLFVALWQSIIWPVQQRLDIRPFRERWERIHHQNTLAIFENFADTVRLPGPKFVFVHVLSPHEPHVFAPDGSFVSRQVRKNLTSTERYRHQIAFLNPRIEHVVEDIFSNSEHPPIVILQADEGPYPPKWDPWAWEKASPEELSERTSILNAYYLPGETDALYDSITPVNSFRVVLNRYFGAELELLPDEIAAHGETHPYKFRSITKELQAFDRKTASVHMLNGREAAKAAEHANPQSKAPAF